MRVVLVLVAGMALVIPTPASAKSWIYRVQVSLPTAGTWTLYVYDRAIGAVTPDPRSRHVVVGPADSVSGAPLGLLAAGAAAVGAARSASPLDDVRVSANASPVRQVEKQSRLHLSSAGSAAGA